MKKFKALTLLVSTQLMFTSIVFAQTSGEPVSSFDDIVGLFSKAAKWMYTFFFIIAVIYILIAAYTYLTAGENADNVKKATKMIRNAVIAIVVALLSSGVALIINSFITT